MKKRRVGEYAIEMRLRQILVPYFAAAMGARHGHEVRGAFQTYREALRAVKPGGKLVLVDFARPVAWHPLKFLWHPVLTRLEPFAPDLWTYPVETWLPAGYRDRIVSRSGYFGGFYQKVVIAV